MAGSRAGGAGPPGGLNEQHDRTSSRRGGRRLGSRPRAGSVRGPHAPRTDDRSGRGDPPGHGPGGLRRGGRGRFDRDRPRGRGAGLVAEDRPPVLVSRGGLRRAADARGRDGRPPPGADHHRRRAVVAGPGRAPAEVDRRLRPRPRAPALRAGRGGLEIPQVHPPPAGLRGALAGCPHPFPAAPDREACGDPAPVPLVVRGHGDPRQGDLPRAPDRRGGRPPRERRSLREGVGLRPDPGLPSADVSQAGGRGRRFSSSGRCGARRRRSRRPRRRGWPGPSARPNRRAPRRRGGPASGR